MSRDRLKDLRGGGAPQGQQYVSGFQDSGVARQPVPSYDMQSNPYGGGASLATGNPYGNSYPQPAGPPPSQSYSQQYTGYQGGNQGYSNQSYSSGQGYSGQGYGGQNFSEHPQSQYGTGMNDGSKDVAGASTTSLDTANGGGGFFNDLAKVQDLIGDLQHKVKAVGDLQSQRLTNTNESFQTHSKVELEKLSQETSKLAQKIRKGLQGLMTRTKKLNPEDPDYRIQRQQVEAAQSKFKQVLEEYSSIEKANRDKYRDRMARQVRIVKPDASDQEVQEAVEGGASTQVFANALLQSRQSGARAAYAEVQARHNDLMQLESKIMEIAQMVNQIGTMVQEQDEQIVGIEATAGTVQTNMKGGLVQTQGAVRKAKRYRMLRWCCAIFWIIVIIIIVVVVAVEETQNRN